MGLPRRKGPTASVRSMRRTERPGPRFNYELFNGNNFNIRYWSWNYRGCWPIDPGAVSPSSPLHDGCSVGGHPFGWDGTSLKRSARDHRHLSALYTGRPRSLLGTLLGISIGAPAPLAFPDPGCLAGIRPSRRGYSTSGHRSCPDPHYLWRQQMER